MKGIFITGATGFLGAQVSRLILERTEYPIVVLVRGRDISDARLRLERSWRDWPGMLREIGGRVRIVNGDLCLPGLGLSREAYGELAGSVSRIIHLAADIRLNEPLDLLRKINVDGTRSVIALAYDVHRHYGLERLSYVSTAYVAGGRKGAVPEDELTDRYGFSNHYELSKYEAESLIQEAGKELPVSVFRPGMVVGDSKSGTVKNFNTIYFPLRLYLSGKLKFLPVDPAMKINMVPGDYVSEAIVRLTFEPRAEGLAFHLTLPAEALPDVRELISFTRTWAEETLHVRLPAPVFLPVSLRRLQSLGRFFPEKSAVRPLLSLASYFEEDRIYRRDNTDRLFGSYQSEWHAFFPQLLTYACDSGFMHRSERTVHEQVYFRLSRKSRPASFYDVTPGNTICRNPEEIRREIELAVFSLKQRGIRKGDRIAVVGFNSSRYFVIDAAIGLSGGVSVPLYYSSPVRELTEIIGSCGARMLFAGVPEIMEKLVSAGLNIPVVSFCREPSKHSLPENFLDWQEFLQAGTDEEPPMKGSAQGQSGMAACDARRGDMSVPVSFGDIATLRYTSGTTGSPKGSVFDHAALRSMAETLASLPPWKARTRRVVYLSFLPMNHVVEGILASYAIFYAPAPVEIYYLENFHELQKALPKIRPTVFFSVPRFYEKVWESASQSFVGRMYLKSRDGFGKRLLGRLLGRAVKKKAGIDRCAQLIAGSAPVSAGLLENFRSIGIEIHNAYGLTEAPLITLNRHLSNRIGTVGEPLPDTKIRIAGDGEVLVSGPQVMRGYFHDEAESPLENGWLHTGDYGLLTGENENYLILNGRKKEVIIDSYGKNINPVKIELMIREATGIDQVMVYGDNRPYCVALLWGCKDAEKAAAIDEGIKQVNRQLSRPEQVKNWAVRPDGLTIEGGELTANLKMKRSAIALKYAETIESLYR